MKQLIAITLLALILPAAALACSCLRYADAAQHIERTDVIFEGVAAETAAKNESDLPDGAETRFQVSKVWKGDVPETATVSHPTEIAAGCGVRFTPGEIYTVFAHRQEDGTLTTSSCSAPQFDWTEYEAVLDPEKFEK